MDEKVRLFLEELNALCERHGMHIDYNQCDECHTIKTNDYPPEELTEVMWDGDGYFLPGETGE